MYSMSLQFKKFMKYLKLQGDDYYVLFLLSVLEYFQGTV